ncbi:MAG: nuclear transport factor 2 family protein [Actinomycetes bacterium]
MTTDRLDQTRDLFANLAQGRQDQFFAHVADDVDWTVMGTHPLAGRYLSKDAFFSATFARLNPRLREGVVLEVEHVFLDGDWAIVELLATSTQNNGRPFANKYCWLCRFSGGQIVEVRAYLDSALVAEVIDSNEGP